MDVKQAHQAIVFIGDDAGRDALFRHQFGSFRDQHLYVDDHRAFSGNVSGCSVPQVFDVAAHVSVGDLMHRGDALPVVSPEADMAETVVTMSEKSLGVAIVAEDGKVNGIITDGDMRRHAKELWSVRAGDIATPDPVSVSDDMRATEALDLMSERKITACLVCGPGRELRGLLHLHDILRAGLGS